MLRIPNEWLILIQIINGVLINGVFNGGVNGVLFFHLGLLGVSKKPDISRLTKNITI
jgi:hypothetical protein